MHFSKLFTVARLLSQPPSSAAQLGPMRTQTGRLFQRYTQSSPQQQSAGPRSSPFTGQATTRRNTQIIQLAEADGSGHVGPTRLWKPVLFTATFCVGTFVAVSIWEYENLATLRLNRKSVEWFRQRVQSQQRHLNERYRVVQNWWAALTPGERVFVPICVLNLAVFGAWRVPALKGFMMAYFCSNPAAKAVCWPMVLSTFSHYSGFHIFANMYVLHSFSNAATLSLGTEQFLGVYLGAGVVSSLASYALKAGTGMAGMSLGASGAIMGILAYVCSKYPDTELGILFLPMVTFSAGSAIKVLMGVDLAGCLLGWKFFDHAAHLGGALVGIFWCYFGAQHIWPKRIYVQQYWHQLRAK